MDLITEAVSFWDGLFVLLAILADSLSFATINRPWIWFFMVEFWSDAVDLALFVRRRECCIPFTQRLLKSRSHYELGTANGSKPGSVTVLLLPSTLPFREASPFLFISYPDKRNQNQSEALSRIRRQTLHYLSPSTFSFFSKNALDIKSYSSGIQTALHLGSNEEVTSRQDLKLEQGYSEHSPQLAILRSKQHLTMLYRHQLSLEQPLHPISSTETIWSL